MDMAREVLPVVKNTPVLAGVCGTDPFRDHEALPPRRAGAGFSGVQNFPTVGLIDGTFRQGLEETDMGFGKEVEMIRLAHELGLLDLPLRVHPGRGGGDGQGRGGRADPAHGADHQGHASGRRRR